MKTQLKNAQYSQQYFYVAFADGMWLLVIFSGFFLCAKNPEKYHFCSFIFFSFQLKVQILEFVILAFRQAKYLWMDLFSHRLNQIQRTSLVRYNQNLETCGYLHVHYYWPDLKRVIKILLKNGEIFVTYYSILIHDVLKFQLFLQFIHLIEKL